MTSNNNGVLCSGSDGGELNINVTGGAFPYTFEWTGTDVDENAEDQTGLEAGTYSVVVTDAAGCTSDATEFTISSQPAISISTYSNATCNNESFGQVSAIVNGGAGAGTFAYQWEDNAGTVISDVELVTDLAAGKYKIKVSDQNGCLAEAFETVVVDNSLNCDENVRNFKVESYGTPETCAGNGDGVAYINITGGSGDYSINWGDLNESSLIPGIYTVEVTDETYNYSLNTTFEIGTSSDDNCFEVCNLNIDLYTFQDVTCSGDDNGKIKLEITGATNPNIKLYEVGNDEPVFEGQLADVDPEQEFYNLRHGKYIVLVNTDNRSCSSTAETSVYAPRTLEIYGSARYICSNQEDSIELSSSVGSNNTWVKEGVPGIFSNESNVSVVEAGTYILTQTTGACTQSVTHEIEEKEDCSTKSPICKQDILPTATINLVERCKHGQYLAGYIHAKHEYDQYIDSVRASFRSRYITKCLSSKEKLEIDYKDKEHHYTLYYYDQANNLVKTVPPEGVKLINSNNYSDSDDRLAQIKLDRTKGEQTVFTDHTYATDYEYNSLNQLIGQKLPDHDAMNLFESDAINYSNLQSGLTINNVEVDQSGKGFLMAETSSGHGVIYETQDGGKSWDRQTTIGTKSLTDISIFNINTAYTVGEKGLFAKSTNVNAVAVEDVNWVVIPVGTTENLVAVNFHTVNDGWVISETGEVFVSHDGGEKWIATTGIGVTDINVVDVSIDAAVSLAYALVEHNGENHVYESTNNGANWSEILEDNLKVSGIQKMVSDKNGDIYLYGDNGVLLKSENNGNDWKWLSNDVVGDINVAYFRADQKGIMTTDNKINRTYNDAESVDETVHPSVLITAGVVVKDLAININDNQGMVITSNEAFTTLNGGMSLTEASTGLSGLLGSNTLEAVAISTDLTGVAVAADNQGNFYNYYLGIWTLNANGLSAGDVISGGLYIFNNKVHVITVNGEYASKTASSAFTIDGLIAGVSNDNIIGLAQKGGNLYMMNSNEQLFESDDNGTSWTEITNNLASLSVNISNFNISTQGVYTATSADGTIAVSTNGVTWLDKGANVTLTGATSIHFNNNYVMIGGDNGLVSVINKTQNDPWQLIGAGSGAISTGKPDVTDVKYVDDTKVIVATSNNGVLSSTNTGEVWSGASVTSSTVSSNSSKFNSISKLTSVNYAVGDNEVCEAPHGENVSQNLYDVEHFDTGGDIAIAVGEHGNIMRWDDSGTESKWVCLTIVDALVLYDTEMEGKTGIGYGVGANGTVVKTEDAGDSWDNQNTGQTNDLFAVAFTSISEGVAVGANGTIIRTINGGEDHFDAPVSSPTTTQTLNEVAWAGNTHAYIVGDGGVILRTINKGINWDNVTTNAVGGGTLSIGGNLKAISFADERVGYVAGADGKVYRFERLYDGTEEWKDVSIVATDKTINDIYFVDYERGYAVGDEGVVFKTVNGGDTWTSETDIYDGNANLTFIEPLGKNKFLVGGDQSTVTKTIDQADLYSVKFWYDELGRIVAKQDARQFPENKFSYTIYDDYNRIVESGEVVNSTQAISDLGKFNIPSQVNYKDYLVWLNGDGINPIESEKHEVSLTRYDAQVINWTNSSFDPTFKQENLRPRVSSTFYIDEAFKGDASMVIEQTTDVDYDFASHYSYDEHGNVATLINENKHLEHLGQSFKRLDYSYDLISGNVNEVAYQEGEKDEFYHRYEYDEDNRIVKTQTSHDDVVWETDAEYDYYRHSVLKRTELGDDKVQGIDYAYTIHGWLKGVNSETLNSSRDLGQDGLVLQDGGETQDLSAKDVFGFGLKYYSGDYLSVGAQNAVANETGLYTELNNIYGDGKIAHTGLYNGNISGMVTAIDEFMQGSNPSPQLMLYKYDQLNRIKQARAYENTSIATANNWDDITSKPDYQTSYKYDANGNLTNLNRYGTLAKGQMDEFEYQYENLDNGYIRNTNRLVQVRDNELLSGNYDVDVDHQINTNNYIYDGIGNLKQDLAEEIKNIVWHVNGKVKAVERTAGSTKSDLGFFYDAMGQRTVKVEKPRDANGLLSQSEWKYTYYSRDASGNTMAHYKRTFDDLGNSVYDEQLNLTEQDIYGSSRIGQYKSNDPLIAERTFTANITLNKFVNQTDLTNIVYTNSSEGEYHKGGKTYELSNHLGNVLAVVSDRIIPILGDGIKTTSFEANVVAANDYYPFGMYMPGRTKESDEYRYGFQGQERDPETGLVDYTYRMYDARIGRFLAVDPIARGFAWNSPYAFSENKVIACVEFEGLEAIESFKATTNILIIVIEGYDGEPVKGATQIGTYDKTELRGVAEVITLIPDAEVVSFMSSTTDMTQKDVQQSIVNFKAVNPDGKVVLVGHSLGAQDLVEMLDENRDIKADLLVTLDNIDHMWKYDDNTVYSNVKNGINYKCLKGYIKGELTDYEGTANGVNIGVATTHKKIDNVMLHSVMQDIVNFNSGLDAPAEAFKRKHSVAAGKVAIPVPVVEAEAEAPAVAPKVEVKK